MANTQTKLFEKTPPPLRLLEQYLLANAAEHLISFMRGDPYIERLKADNSLDALIDLVVLLGSKGAERDLEEVVLAYSALVAVFESSKLSNEERLNLADKSHLRWGRRIIEILDSAPPSSSFAALSVPKIHVGPVSSFSKTSSQTETVRLELP